EVLDSLRLLRKGDIIQVPAGKQAGPAVVLDPGYVSGGDGPRPTVLTVDRQVRRLSMVYFPTPVEAEGRLRLPRPFNPRNAHARRDLASALRENARPRRTEGDRGGRRERRGETPSPAAQDGVLPELRARLRRHPCHGCADREDHARWAERYFKLERETRGLQRRIEQRSNTIARQFDRV